MMYSIDGYFIDEPENTFYNFIVSEYNCIPKKYRKYFTDDQVFFYGITPVEGNQYDDFVVTSVVEI